MKETLIRKEFTGTFAEENQNITSRLPYHHHHGGPVLPLPRQYLSFGMGLRLLPGVWTAPKIESAEVGACLSNFSTVLPLNKNSP